jgi:hypothetical protein
MEIQFRRPELHALCNSRAQLARGWGRETSELIAQRLHEIAALDCLADLYELPHILIEPHASRLQVAVNNSIVITLGACDGERPLVRRDPVKIRAVVVEAIDGKDQER